MKSALTVVLFRLFTIGVCVEGYEVSVTEGDSVTLKSGVTEIQTRDEIEWMFNGTLIATISRGDSGISVWVKADGSFRDRLQLDNQTGDLKISNISTTDSGEYKPLISSIRGSPPEVTFTVKVVPVDVFADEVESVLGLEGYSVTLHTHLTEIQGDDVIQWRFGQQKSLVAEINRTSGIKTYDFTDERFRDRLKLDQTGSLIIIDTRTTDSGLYKVYISSSRGRHTIHHTQSFSLTVRDYVKSMSVLEGDNVPLRPDLTGTERIEQIRWTFGDDEIIADLNGPLNKDNFGLNKQTGELIIRNIQTDQSGLYKMEIKTRIMMSHRKYQITVVALPGQGLSPAVPDPGLSPDHLDPRLSSDGPGLSPAAVAGNVVGLLLAAAVGAAAGVFYYRHKKSKEELSETQLSVLYEQLKVIHMRKEASETQLCESAGSGPKNSSIPMAVEELYEKLEELFKNQSQLSDEHVPLNSNVIYVPDHPPSRNNGEMDKIYDEMTDDTENVSMKNLCGSQSAGSDTENSPFREIKGNKEHGYDIL